MGPNEMREAARALPDEYLANYCESYESGIVGPYVDPATCVAACTVSGTATGEPDARIRALTRAQRPGDPYAAVLNALEDGYWSDSAADSDAEEKALESAFRTRLYDAFTEERAARAAAAIVSTPPPVKCW